MTKQRAWSGLRQSVIYLAGICVIMGTTGMHIPDGYLSPIVSIVLFALVLPFWAAGFRQLRLAANGRTIPLIALMAAFTFIIMMFNVPLPGGTTGHAVGASIAAILLGPGIATIAVSIALVMQAVLFGDGGILAIGANCFTMAVVMPYVSYAVFRWVAGRSPMLSVRRLLAAGAAGYLGLTAAAFLTAVLFGIQPALFTNAAGVPLYAPYPLSIALPAIMIPHLLVASVIEALLTAAIYAYIRRAQPMLLDLQPAHAAAAVTTAPSTRVLWLGLLVLIILTPLGLLAPGTAWGEWGAEELAAMGLGFIPAGLEKLGTLWGAPMPDYEIPALGNMSLSYILSAFVGAAVTVLLAWLFGVLFKAKGLTDEQRPG